MSTYIPIQTKTTLSTANHSKSFSQPKYNLIHPIQQITTTNNQPIQQTTTTNNQLIQNVIHQPIQQTVGIPMNSKVKNQSIISKPIQQSMISKPIQQTSVSNNGIQQSMISRPNQSIVMSSKPIQQTISSKPIQQTIMSSTIQQPLYSSQLIQPNPQNQLGQHTHQLQNQYYQYQPQYQLNHQPQTQHYQLEQQPTKYNTQNINILSGDRLEKKKNIFEVTPLHKSSDVSKIAIEKETLVASQSHVIETLKQNFMQLKEIEQQLETQQKYQQNFKEFNDINDKIQKQLQSIKNQVVQEITEEIKKKLDLDSNARNMLKDQIKQDVQKEINDYIQQKNIQQQQQQQLESNQAIMQELNQYQQKKSDQQKHLSENLELICDINELEQKKMQIANQIQKIDQEIEHIDLKHSKSQNHQLDKLNYEQNQINKRFYQTQESLKNINNEDNESELQQQKQIQLQHTSSQKLSRNRYDESPDLYRSSTMANEKTKKRLGANSIQKKTQVLKRSASKKSRAELKLLNDNIREHNKQKWIIQNQNRNNHRTKNIERNGQKKTQMLNKFASQIEDIIAQSKQIEDNEFVQNLEPQYILE